MTIKLLNYKSLVLIFFLFGYSNLYAFGGTSTFCRAQERRDKLRRDIVSAHKIKICNERSQGIAERRIDKHTYLYLRIPKLGDEYLEYGNEDLEYNLEPDKRKERAIPIYIELNNETILNPRKEDREKYEVSSKIKEQIIAENSTITRKSCTFMALGSEYLFPIPAKKGLLSIILYFDYSKDFANFNEFKKDKFMTHYPENYFEQFIHRGLQTEVDFKEGRIYQIEIALNPNSALPRGSYNATSFKPFQTMNTVPGFTITLKELPPNTKFAFDGKDDIGKTYEQVKKEFILYDHEEKKTKE